MKINGLVQWPDLNGCIGEVQTDGGPCLDGRLVWGFNAEIDAASLNGIFANSKLAQFGGRFL